MKSSRAPLSGRRVAWLAAMAGCWSAQGQQSRPDLAGMWSDPPATIEDTFCFVFCTDAGLQRLEQLLDDDANAERPLADLYAEASAFQHDQYIKPRLTPAAAATLGIDPTDNPGFLECEPWAFAWEIFAPHQLEIEQHADRVELLYGEWTVRRTVYLDGREPGAGVPSSAMGYSVGRYEGDALVIETTRISASWPHGGQEAFRGRSTAATAISSAASSATHAPMMASDC